MCDSRPSQHAQMNCSGWVTEGIRFVLKKTLLHPISNGALACGGEVKKGHHWDGLFSLPKATRPGVMVSSSRYNIPHGCIEARIMVHAASFGEETAISTVEGYTTERTCSHD